MKTVTEAPMFPSKCAVTGDIDGPWIDMGAWANFEIPTPDGWSPPYIYLHVPLVEQVARDELGMVPKKDVEVLEEVVKHLADQNEELKAELATYKNVRKALAKVG